jgi:ABC-type amino acid transport substrate-binding protein
MSILNEIISTKKLKIGYADYLNYVHTDKVSGSLSGFSISLATEIANRMKVSPVFVKSSWNDFLSDSKDGKFHLFTGPVFHSIDRLFDVDFPEPFGQYSAFAALVKNSDTRFKELTDLNKAGIVLGVLRSWSQIEYAKSFLKNATLKIYDDEDPILLFEDLVSGLCDVALSDGPSLERHLEIFPNQNTKALFLENPAYSVNGGFSIPKDDPSWLEFLNQSLRILKIDGTFKEIAKKFHLNSLI